MSEPNANRQPRETEVVELCKMRNLPTGDFSRRFDVDGYRIALFRVSGNLYAINDMCPHEDQSLAAGVVGDHEVFCPRHCWNFDLRTGISPHVLGASVKSYAVEVDAGSVLIRVPVPRWPGVFAWLKNQIIARLHAKLLRNDLRRRFTEIRKSCPRSAE